MKGKRILLVGYGKLGRRVAHKLSEKHEVIALKRRLVDQVDQVKMCFADVAYIESLKENLSVCAKDGIDYLIYCLSPSERSEQGYRDAYLNGLKNVLTSLPNSHKLKHVIFISSTSVYHQENNEHVDEQSSCTPKNFSGRVLLETESYLSSLSTPSSSIRFSGIYGGTRSRLIDQVRHALVNDETLNASHGFTNRIHEDDCVGFICHLIDLLDQGQKIEACYVATDSYPVEQAEVYTYIAQQLAKTEQSLNSKSLRLLVSEEAKSTRRAGSKRCVNKLMLGTGYTLAFESYREGYKQVAK